MELEQIYYGVEIVGVAAVIASLIFVGVQVNHNTKAMRSAAAQTHIAGWSNYCLTQAINPKLLETLNAEYREPWPSTEALQIHLMVEGQLKTMELNYFQWLDGSLSDELWRASREAFIRELELTPAYEEIIARDHAYYSPRFIEFCRDSLTTAKARLEERGLSTA